MHPYSSTQRDGGSVMYDKEDNEIKEVACTLDPLILHVQPVVLLVAL